MPGGMNDFEFAAAVDAALWISPSGDGRDNRTNFRAVMWSLEERRLAIELLDDLLAVLLPLFPWREHAQLASPLLEALIFVDEQAGGREVLAKSDAGGEP
jgi:hypothetical protein